MLRSSFGSIIVSWSVNQHLQQHRCFSAWWSVSLHPALSAAPVLLSLVECVAPSRTLSSMSLRVAHDGKAYSFKNLSTTMAKNALPAFESLVRWRKYQRHLPLKLRTAVLLSLLRLQMLSSAAKLKPAMLSSLQSARRPLS